MSLRVLAVVVAVAALGAPRWAAAHEQPPPADVQALYADKPVIELVTMGIGALIWERHGHIALCVRYADPREDTCYNYGIGSFEKPLGMAWGFFRGTNSFWVGKSPRRQMLWIYQYTDRTIWTQPIPLSPEQKQRVIEKLERDILPENRYYAYDHFWDNCTTRVRDVLDDVTGGALSKMQEPTDDRTFRDLARDGFYGMRVPLLITDIAMGRVTDRVPTYFERMFLPQYLREAAYHLWGVEPIVEYQRRGPLAEAEAESEARRLGKPPVPLDDGASGRVLFALIILVATASAWATRLWGRFERLGIGIAIVPPALLGLVLWFLAIISPLPYVRANESCLVFFPFDLLVLVLPEAKRRLYARGRVAMLGLVVLLMLVGVLTQPIWETVLWPLVPLAVIGFWPPGARRDIAVRLGRES